MTHTRVSAFLLALAVVWPSVSAAQIADGSDTARFHLGPLSLTPKLAIRNLGLDTNVFNTKDEPLQDFTVTLTPGVDAWLRVGRGLFTSKTIVDWDYYQTASSERAFNFGEDWRVDVDLTHVQPRVAGEYLRTRQRPNDEIDARVQQKRMAGGIGVPGPIGSRVNFDLDARRIRYDYSQGEYGDPALAEALNRDSDEITGTARVALTPLTTLAVRAQSTRDRFAFTPARDSDSWRVMPGVTFQPFALISGSAFVGYRRFTTVSPAVPDFSGVVAAVELKYIAADLFRITGLVKRDVDYSLDLGEPFYVSNSAGVDVLQVIGLSWDVVGRVRRSNLVYQQAAPGEPARVDRLRSVGVGLGRRLGQDFRIGVDVDYVKRTSVVPSRAFEGLRFGGSLTYGY
jgi:hypothetical protein